MSGAWIVSFLLLLGPPAFAREPVDAGAQQGPALAQMREFARTHGEALWPGYGSTALDFLLVSATQETLLCRDEMPAGFTAAGSDAATGCARYVRSRTDLPDSLLAAMPIFGPPATIVMGTPQSTGRSEAEWLRTILHEHFHQWQMALPDYFARVEALGLSHGDTSGSWMLNFAFPYDATKPARAYTRAAHALATAIEARGTRAFAAAFSDFITARRDFSASVTPEAWRYLDFEQWQEGGARWAEIALGKHYPRADVRAAATKLEHASLEQLRHADLKAQRRELVYAFGAAQLELLEACAPGWRVQYRGQLALTPLLDAALAPCHKAAPRKAH